MYIYLSLYLSIYVSMYLTFFLSFSIFLYTYLCIQLNIFFSIFLTFCLMLSLTLLGVLYLSTYLIQHFYQILPLYNLIIFEDRDFKFLTIPIFQFLYYFVYQKALIRTFHTIFWLQNNLFEFTAREHKFKGWFCSQKPVWNIHLKDIWYTEINLTDLVWRIQLIWIYG